LRALNFFPGPLREFKISHGKIPDLRPRGAFQCRPTVNILCKNVSIDAMFDDEKKDFFHFYLLLSVDKQIQEKV
jgi:hypothetical protein